MSAGDYLWRAALELGKLVFAIVVLVAIIQSL